MPALGGTDCLLVDVGIDVISERLIVETQARAIGDDVVQRFGSRPLVASQRGRPQRPARAASRITGACSCNSWRNSCSPAASRSRLNRWSIQIPRSPPPMRMPPNSFQGMRSIQGSHPRASGVNASGFDPNVNDYSTTQWMSFVHFFLTGMACSHGGHHKSYASKASTDHSDISRYSTT